MKKIVSMLGLICLVAGCSCNRDIYKFDSVKIGDETYTCSKKDKEDTTVKAICDNFEGMSIELKDEDTLIVNFPEINIVDKEEEYKIENGYLMMKDEEEWHPLAQYKDDSLVIESGYATVTLKK